MDKRKLKKKYTRQEVIRNRIILGGMLALMVIAVVILSVKLIGKKDNSKEAYAQNNSGEQRTTEEQTSMAEPEETVEAGAIKHVTDESMKGHGEYPGQVKVYLTFDDGTSENTQQILDTLDKYGVKATFFLCCNSRDRDIENMKRIVSSGNSLAIHSVTHIYNEIYASLDSFKEDVLGMQKYLYDMTGYKTWLYRFPGGSNNNQHAVDIKQCQQFLNDSGFLYFDWNVSSLDANSNNMTADDVYNNVMCGIDGSKEEYIVLMHDLNPKKFTADALPRFIEACQAKGYMILPITENTKPMHFGD